MERFLSLIAFVKGSVLFSLYLTSSTLYLLGEAVSKAAVDLAGPASHPPSASASQNTCASTPSGMLIPQASRVMLQLELTARMLLRSLADGRGT